MVWWTRYLCFDVLSDCLSDDLALQTIVLCDDARFKVYVRQKYIFVIFKITNQLCGCARLLKFNCFTSVAYVYARVLFFVILIVRLFWRGLLLHHLVFWCLWISSEDVASAKDVQCYQRSQKMSKMSKPKTKSALVRNVAYH